MQLPQPLVEGQFIKRYKRFFADVIVNGQTITAHVPNTGSLKGCLEESAPCILTQNNDPKRKLKYTLQMIYADQSWAGINTGLTNKLVYEFYQNSQYWPQFDCCQPEIKVNDKSRIDFVMWNSEEFPNQKLKTADLDQHSFHFVEVKNVTLKEKEQALFPDAVTTRGQKHIEELCHLIKQGHTAEIFFAVQRENCTVFSPEKDIDPKYAQLLKTAKQDHGLKISAFACQFSSTEIILDKKAPLKINL